jgi:hypothetical protein
MNRPCLLAVVVAAIFAVACASTEPNSAEQRSEKRYLTGSRIPAPDGSTSANVKSVDGKEGVDDTLRGRDVVLPPKGGPQ